MDREQKGCTSLLSSLQPLLAVAWLLSSNKAHFSRPCDSRTPLPNYRLKNLLQCDVAIAADRIGNTFNHNYSTVALPLSPR
jgi:hypothetical protein